MKIPDCKISLLPAILVAAAMAVCAIPVSAQIFYKITYPDNDRTSYLLGTHHLAPVSVLDSITDLPVALASADMLIGEIDISAMSDPIITSYTMQAMTAPPDSTLDKLLTCDELERVARAIDRYSPGLMPQFIYRFKPAVIDSMLAQLISAKLEGGFTSGDIDTAMQTRAATLGLPIDALETPEEQTDLIYGTPVSSQTRALIATVDSLDKVEAQIKDLSEAYLTRDMSAIIDAMAEAYSEDPEGYRRLVTDRNSAWLRRLLVELPRRSLMIVVGAGHLPGEDGLINGLRDAGYTVTPVY